MSTQAAHKLIRAIRENPHTNDQFLKRSNDCTVQDLIALGAAQGWTFDASEFSEAFRQDWLLRWLNFCTKGRNS